MNDIKCTIPAPCNESWQNMDVVEQGRFCSSCKKNVIDFTGMSDREAYNIILSGDANMCGRFSMAQMNTGIRYPEAKKQYWPRYFFSFLLPALLFTKQSGAQVGKIARPLTESNHTGKKKIILPFTERYFELSGRVLDSATGIAIEGTTLTFDGMAGETKADNAGFFILKGKVKNTAVIIRITSVGYQAKEIPLMIPANDFIVSGETFYLDQQSVRLENVQLYAKSDYLLQSVMGGIVAGVKINRLHQVTSRMLTAIKDSVRIYPNPVTRGNAFKLALRVKKSGIHTIQVVNAGGQIIYQQAINAAGRQYNTEIKCESKWSTGIYILRIIENDKRIISTASFVVE